MFFNFIKIAWRNIKRQKIYSIINIAGFAIGLTISLVLAFYVLDDITFDRFHRDANSIYRIIMNSAREGGNYQNAAIISGPLLPASRDEIPEVLYASRLINFNQVPIVRSSVERAENDDAVRTNILAVDSDFFDIFSFNILSGNISDFKQPNAVFITPEIASAVFGEEDPSRKPLSIPNVQDAYVAGIVESPPNNSHIQFDIIVPLRVELNPVWWDSWENQVLSGYIRIHENADPKLVEEKIINLTKAHEFPDVYIPALQPLLNIHLGSSDLAYDFRNFGKKDSSIIYVMSAIGFMILLVASINFVNLSSARAVKRAREVGLRKVVGSKRWQLILQFLGESTFVTLISMLIAMMIIQFSLPYLENFLQKRLEINFISNPLLILILFGFAILVGFFSGIYPALILSTFKPAKVLKGEFETSKSGVIMRRILVISQFAITVALIVGVFTVVIQINYLKSINLGYNREQVLGIPNFLGDREDILKKQLENMPGVVSVGRSSRLMGEGLSIETIPEGTDPSRSVNWSCIYIDEDFFKTLEISMANGRNFSSEITSDGENAAIINEAGL
jgi:putative ABC transport system permease protein